MLLERGNPSQPSQVKEPVCKEKRSEKIELSDEKEAAEECIGLRPVEDILEACARELSDFPPEEECMKKDVKKRAAAVVRKPGRNRKKKNMTIKNIKGLRFINP
jgi:hypothetical protein